MSVLVDTNIFLRCAQPSNPHFVVAVSAISNLMSRGEDIYVTTQVISEFWNVATRPERYNGLGWPAETAQAALVRIEQETELLFDNQRVYEEWKRLIFQYEVKGVKVHDAKLAAATIAHGVNRLLTFNTADFVRFGIGVAHPMEVAR